MFKYIAYINQPHTKQKPRVALAYNKRNGTPHPHTHTYKRYKISLLWATLS